MPKTKSSAESPTSPILSSSTTSINQFQNLRFILISMAVFISLSILSLLLFLTFSSAARHHPTDTNTDPSINNNIDEIINQACNASRDPPTCQSSLRNSSHVPSDATISDVIRSALLVSSENLQTGKKMVQDILDTSADNKNRSDTAKIGLEVLHYAEHRINLTSDALTRGGIKDARAWMSAALAYQYGCWSGLKNVNDTLLVSKTMSFLNSSSIPSCIDALSMMVNYDIYGNDTTSWGPPKTERDGFWEPSDSDESSGSGSSTAGVPLGMTADVTVCKGGGGGCDYKTVQEAVNAAPDNAGKRFVIRVKEGVYEEIVRVPLEKRNLVLLGDGMGKTVISGSMNVGQQGVSTYNSATVGK